MDHWCPSLPDLENGRALPVVEKGSAGLRASRSRARFQCLRPRSVPSRWRRATRYRASAGRSFQIRKWARRKRRACVTACAQTDGPPRSRRADNGRTRCMEHSCRRTGRRLRHTDWGQARCAVARYQAVPIPTTCRAEKTYDLFLRAHCPLARARYSLVPGKPLSKAAASLGLRPGVKLLNSGRSVPLHEPGHMSCVT